MLPQVFLYAPSIFIVTFNEYKSDQPFRYTKGDQLDYLPFGHSPGK